jgi:hypothetical protein
MRVLIILAAFTFAALTPYLGALPRGGAMDLLDVEDPAPSAAEEVEDEWT